MARTVATHLAEQVSHQKPELTRLASKVPRKLPKLPARRNALVEKVMPSVENVEKVGIPLPKVKGEKVEKEKRNKYLKAVVYSTMALGQEKGDTWTHVRGRSQAAIMSRIAKDFPFPDFPWDKKPVIKKHFALAFKTGLEQGILVQQDWNTGKGSGCFKLSKEEIKKIKISRGSGAGGKNLFETDPEVGSDVASLAAGGNETNMDLSDLDENINTDLKEAAGIEELLDSEDEWTLSKYYRNKD